MGEAVLVDEDDVGTLGQRRNREHELVVEQLKGFAFGLEEMASGQLAVSFERIVVAGDEEAVDPSERPPVGRPVREQPAVSREHRCAGGGERAHQRAGVVVARDRDDARSQPGDWWDDPLLVLCAELGEVAHKEDRLAAGELGESRQDGELEWRSETTSALRLSGKALGGCWMRAISCSSPASACS